MSENTHDQDFEPIEEKEIPTSEVPELTEEQQEQLHLYKKALEEELIDSETGSDVRQIRDKTRTKLIDLVPDALTSMKYLSTGANSDSVRYQASKWILDSVLAPNGNASTKDAMQELLEEMLDNEKKKKKKEADA